LTARLNIMSHRCEIIPLRVPANPGDDMFEVHFNHFKAKAVVGLKLPFNVLFLLVRGFGIDIVLLLPFIHICFGLFVQFLAVKLCLNNIYEFLVNSGEQ